MAKKSARPVSLNPDTFVAGGLPSDFDGVIKRAVFCGWDYNGNIDEPVLAVALTIQPDEGQDVEDEFVQHYSAGYLDSFKPSQDGKSEVDLEAEDQEDAEGHYVVAVGTREALGKTTNFAQFLRALGDCGFSDFGDSLEFLEGLHGHFVRVPQEKRSGIVREEEEEGDSNRRRNNDILVISKLIGGKTKGKKAAPAKTSSKKAKEEEDDEEETPKAAKGKKSSGGDDLDEQLKEIVLGALIESTDDDGDPVPVAKQDLGKIVLKSKDFDNKTKGKAMKRITSEEFLSQYEDDFTYDAEEGTVSVA